MKRSHYRRRRYTKRKRFFRHKFRGKRNFRFGSKYKKSVATWHDLGLADSVVTKLRWNYDFVTTPDILGGISFSIRGNSIWDPWTPVQGGTKRPNLVDIWEQFYTKYLVLGSAYRIDCMQLNESLAAVTNNYNELSVFPMCDKEGPTGFDSAAAQPYCKRRMNTRNNGMNQIRSYMSTAKIFGVDKAAVMGDNTYYSLMADNPSNTWYWMTYYQINPDTGSSHYFHCEVTYYVKLFGRKAREIPSVTNTGEQATDDSKQDNTAALNIPVFPHQSGSLCNAGNDVTNADHDKDCTPPAMFALTRGTAYAVRSPQDAQALVNQRRANKRPCDCTTSNTNAIMDMATQSDDGSADEEAIKDLKDMGQVLTEETPVPAVKQIVKKPDQRTLDGEPILSVNKKQKTVKPK